LAHFGASLVGCEHPFNASAARISLLFPSGNFAAKPFCVVNSAIRAVAAQDADLDLDHGEPACVLGGVMEFMAM